MKIPATALLLTLVFLSTGCQSQSRESARGLSSAGKSDLLEVSGRWDPLFNQGQAAKLAALYSENTVSMPPNASTIHGRKALQAEFEGFFTAHIAKHETWVEDILKDGDLAIERARYRLTFRPKAGGAEIVETGRHIECRQKIAGEWLIVWEIWNVDTPSAK